MITGIGGKRKRVALVGSGVLLVAGVAVATTAGMSSDGARHAPSPSHRYADYLDSPSSSDPCALPVAQRTGGWVCPAGAGQK